MTTPELPNELPGHGPDLPASVTDPQALLREAVAALTRAGRRTWTSIGPDGRTVTHPADWAEFVTLALSGAAANLGGIEVALRGRPGSWEADGVRSLLTSTVGHDEEYLLEHRTEPLVVELYVEEILADLGVTDAYDSSVSELSRRYDTVGLADATDSSLTQEQLETLDTEWLPFQSGSARLLPRVIAGRQTGPLFLADRRPAPARTPATADVCPATGRGRLSYERAEYL